MNKLVPSSRRVRAFNSMFSLNARRNAMQIRYQSFIAASSKGILLSVSMFTLGGWLYGGEKNVAVRAVQTFGKACGFFIQSHAAAAVMYNAVCLVDGLKVAFIVPPPPLCRLTVLSLLWLSG